ncbi:MAG: acyltransferase domain-containing protein [Pseudazoarcus pumilus]|nr:acyltransferase domain-containing protein [Pseudazoarcus pumilus]
MSLCWLCPGQGSQTPEMLAQLADDELAGPQLAGLSRHVAADTLAVADDPTHCFDNQHAQPLIVLYGLSVAETLRAAGISPAVVAGYSVGELTAHAAAQGMTPDTALTLARRRAACMDAASPRGHGLLAVRGLPLDAVRQQAMAAGAAVSIVNGTDHVVLAGPHAALAALELTFTDQGAHVVPLAVSVPAHSHWLAQAVAPFRSALEAAPWQPHAAPVPSCIDGRAVRTRDAAIDALSRQLAEPLDWARVLDVARELGATVFFELGPGDSLTRMVRERHPDLEARALSDFATLRGAAAWLARAIR